MEWSEEEKRALHRKAEAAFIGVQEWDPAVREDCNNRNMTTGLHLVADAIASSAVELAAARGGTMTAEQLREAGMVMTPGAAAYAWGDVKQHIAALGARNAVLETERDTLSRRLEETNQRAQENWEKSRVHIDGLEKSLENARIARVEAERQRDSIRQDRDTAVSLSSLFRMERDSALKRAEVADAESATHLAWMKEERARAEHAEERVRQLAIAGQELSAAVDKHVGEPPRYPCSPTCTHDDAAFPGHAGLIVERSEAFKVVADLSLSVTEAAAYEQGAEAMRAACWEAIRRECQKDGIGETSYIFRRFKAAIEGAAP